MRILNRNSDSLNKKFNFNLIRRAHIQKTRKKFKIPIKNRVLTKKSINEDTYPKNSRSNKLMKKLK